MLYRNLLRFRASIWPVKVRANLLMAPSARPAAVNL
jgi:hypothetical protein